VYEYVCIYVCMYVCMYVRIYIYIYYQFVLGTFLQSASGDLSVELLEGRQGGHPHPDYEILRRVQVFRV
jgi:hypothetical protein